MGNIETQLDLANDLTIITADGKMSASDFQKWTASYYTGRVTSLAIWDLTRADLSDINSDDLREDAVRTKSLAGARKGGKTAIVSRKPLEFGLGRMLEAFYKIEDMPFDVQTFHSIDEAKDWLGI
jgi:hypothetical protein